MDLSNSFDTVFPQDVRDRYDFFEVRSAAAVYRASNPRQFDDLVSVLREFHLYTSDLVTPGGSESEIPKRLNGGFRARGWREARVDTLIKLSLQLAPYGGESKREPLVTEVTNEGYKVDNFLGRVALDVEWNAKDGNLDRDIAAYRALYDQALIDVAVIVTRTQGELRELGRQLGVEAGRSEKEARKILGTTTTTNTDKLVPRMSRGDAGGCPLLAVAICDRTWAGRGAHPPVAAPMADVEESPGEEELPVSE